jgi:hypothetical protein
VNLASYTEYRKRVVSQWLVTSGTEFGFDSQIDVESG